MAAISGMFRTKSVEQSIRDTDEPDSKLRRELTAKDLTIFGVAVVIGACIFTLTARTAGTVAGPSVSLAFVFAAVACGLTTLCTPSSPRPSPSRAAPTRSPTPPSVR
jgi:basic amino acid/polyamine antiporter, APA family